ncbi:leukosialin [Tenrec ecaudatus]|uniref:leukosialin n=1 Tax=Tenrec ecaudatus TaxID=94439 RepID=UPI003F5941C5
MAMETALLLLFCGCAWAQESTPALPAWENISHSPVSLDHNLTAPDPVKIDSAAQQILTLPPSTADLQAASLAISDDAHTVPPVPEPTTLQDVFIQSSSVLTDTAGTTSDPPDPPAHPRPSGTRTNSLTTSNGTSGLLVTIATSSRETFSVASEPSVTKAATSLEITNVTSGLLLTKVATSLETTSVTSGPSLTKEATSLEITNVTSGPSLTKEATSLETTSVTSGPSLTKAARSLEITSVTSGPSLTKAVTSLETTSVTGKAPVIKPTSFHIKVSSTAPWETSLSTTLRLSPQAEKDTGSTLLIAVLVALLVVIVLVALLLLWCRRQRRRTGSLMLTKSAKRNKVVDAWAGPAQVPDEEMVTATVGGSAGDKAAGTPDGERPGRRPTLTTFFGRRKSRQGSLALEELEAGPAASPKAEEEPLVGSEGETPNGSEVRDDDANE